jgi:hypothetical protein
MNHKGPPHYKTKILEETLSTLCFTKNSYLLFVGYFMMLSVSRLHSMEQQND